MKTDTTAIIAAKVIYWLFILGFAILTSYVVDGDWIKCVAWFMGVAFLRSLMQEVAKDYKEDSPKEDIQPMNIKSKFQQRMDEYQNKRGGTSEADKVYNENALWKEFESDKKGFQERIKEMQAQKQKMDSIGSALANGDCGKVISPEEMSKREQGMTSVNPKP